ncbi:MAG: DUF2617 family protein [Planctomycetia bacterium]|nr:DUF2617 family protein [Planctomycetia bacterium]
MSVRFVRPDVSELGLAIFGRTLHPELFVIQAQTTITHHSFVAHIAITNAGHVVQLKSSQHLLCEVVAPHRQPLPSRFLLFDKNLRSSRDESLCMPNGVDYHLSFQVERLDPEIYLRLHEEFCIDCKKATLGHIFATPNRLAPAAVSYLQADLFPRSLLIHAFHTFPKNCAVVKTQTLIELPKP